MPGRKADGVVAKSYIERLPQGIRRDIDDNGDLLIRRMGKAEVVRKKFCLSSPSRPG
jgi:hypothetical protein